MTGELSVDQFEEFFAAVHGHDPFSWQHDLLAQVDRDRAWPDLLDVPTAGGKTALLDVAIFALALDATRPASQRWAPRRIAMVVDRRIVVDQTATRAERIVAAMLNPPAGAVSAMATALSGLSTVGIPARSATLRGGLVRDVGWARWPDVPLLLSSTVDQVGSRLLFRGYGVSPGMRPIHAGLLGNDTLLVLDEVHLSQPFAQTLRSLRDRYQRYGEAPGNHRWAVIELSATPRHSPGRAVVVDPAVTARRGSDQLLVRRFTASKPTRLRLVSPKRGDPPRLALVEAAVEECRRTLKEATHVRRLGIVVNRVATAQAIGSALAAPPPPAAPPDDGIAVHVMTGRLRPLDRDNLVKEVTGRLGAGVDRAATSPRIVLVATQCLEAGADLDLDALITECASLDALRQRFGRVDRLGELAAQGTPAPGVILAARPDVAADARDPVYGTALQATWAWLEEHQNLDFGITALQPPTGHQLAPLLAPHPDAPVLRPGDLDRWVQTQPAPTPDPDPALWLHGLEAAPAEIGLVWRADLTEELLHQDLAAQTAESTARTQGRDIVAVSPPSNSETLSIPVAAVRRWLTDGHVAPVADVDGADIPDDTPPAQTRPFLVWTGDNSRVSRTGSELRPGDVIVVPATYGGCGPGGWDPTSTAAVEDLAHRAHLHDSGTVTLRLHPKLWPQDLPTPPHPDAISQEDDDSPETLVSTWLASVADRPPTGLADGIHWLRRVGYSIRRPEGGADWYVLVGRRPLPAQAGAADGSQPENVDSEPDTSSFTATEVPLDDHLAGVGSLAGRLARTCGLSDELAADLELAGRLHDLGKVDRRCQLMLNGGDELAAALATHPLAKSSLPADDVLGRRRAAQLSGYPPGTRHETLSVAMAEHVPELRARAHDWDLVLHLIASHHGHARPFPPAIIDPDPHRVTHVVDGTVLAGDTGHHLAALDSGIPDRFWRLVRSYGWYRLAWLEAILRLGDHRCSEQEQRHPVGAQP